MFDPREHGYIPVGPDDTFQHQCAICGECCRDVKECILLDSLDLYNIARLLGKRVTDVITQYTTPLSFDEGFPYLVAKTRPHRDACIFLRAGKCTIHGANPRVCRLYPLGVYPDDRNPQQLNAMIVSKKQHHFTGRTWRVADWLDNCLSAVDREYIPKDAANITRIAPIFRRAYQRNPENAVLVSAHFKYADYDTDKPFMPQYDRNIARLLDVLGRIAGGENTGCNRGHCLPCPFTILTCAHGPALRGFSHGLLPASGRVFSLALRGVPE